MAILAPRRFERGGAPQPAAAAALLLAVLFAGGGFPCTGDATAAGGGSAGGGRLLVGVGSADVTGPAAGVNMMGYAKPGQTSSGIHTRLRARAFIFAESSAAGRPARGILGRAPHAAAAEGGKRVVFVSLDACMAPQAVTSEVVARLSAKYGGAYTEDNVAVSGIHTHSGPGGYLEYVLYGVTSLGFVKESFSALVDGIVEAVDAAHADLSAADLAVGEAEVVGASVNRSPTAYLLNPEAERGMYPGDVDTKLVQVTITSPGPAGPAGPTGDPRGVLNWFPVHCTSMNNSNTLISGDNKGAASQLLEKGVREGALATGRGGHGLGGSFIAAFAQGAVGDTSPNTQGAFCSDSGMPCDPVTSTCSGKSEACHGRGPGWPDAFESTRVIAAKQVQAAQSLLAGQAPSAKLDTELGVDFRHTWLDMRNLTVEASGIWGPGGRTCPAAMGFSFAAGTTDGPGAFDFTQGDTHGNAFWKVVRSAIRAPSEAQSECHKPKPILLDTGEMNTPYAWQPSIVAVQLLRVGQVFIACVPGELTTMAGRRVRRAITAAVAGAGGLGPGRPDPTVVVAGLCNTYSSYVTTYEEYQAQRYEGASTIFGPSTLGAYAQALSGMAAAMVRGEAFPPGSPPPNLLPKQISLLPPVVDDEVPAGAAFGGIIEDVAQGPHAPGAMVRAVFHSACPRGMPRGAPLAAVEVLRPDGTWEVLYDDGDWSTKVHWWRPNPILLPSVSRAAVEWEVPPGTPPGTYRLRHFGKRKHPLVKPSAFSGASATFQVAVALKREPR